MQIKHAALATLLAGGAVIGVSSVFRGPEATRADADIAGADAPAAEADLEPVALSSPPEPDPLVEAAQAERDLARADLDSARAERDAIAADLAERDAALAEQAEAAAGRDAEIARLTEALDAQAAVVDRLEAELAEQSLALAALRDAAKILPGADDLDPVTAVAIRPAPEDPQSSGDPAAAAVGSAAATAADAPEPAPAPVAVAPSSRATDRPAPRVAVAAPQASGTDAAPDVGAAAAALNEAAPALRPVSAGPPMEKNALAEVHFEIGSAALTPGGAVRALEAARVLASLGPLRVRIAGHSDTTGSSEMNMRLSRARAEAVAAVLAENGVSSDRIEIEAFGETADMLPVPTAPGVAEPLNRCVSIYPDLASVASQ